MNYIQKDRPKLQQRNTSNKLIIASGGSPLTGEGICALIDTLKHLFPTKKLNAKTIRQSVITNLLKEGKDFIADLVNLCDDVGKDTLSDKIRDSIKPVFESWAGRKYLEEISTEEMDELIHKSRNLALDQLVHNS